METKRPDIQELDPAVRAYIVALESEVARLRAAADDATGDSVAEPAEPPTSINVITISATGLAKRTPRHLYGRQRRGGMGVFDLETPEEDPPHHLVTADENQSLILMTALGRVFRLPVSRLAESPVRGRGQSIPDLVGIQSDERIAVAVPDGGGPFLAILSNRGYVRWAAASILGETMRPGTELYDVGKYGTPVDACWAGSNSELLVATRQGMGIRFSARQLPLHGCALGIRPAKDDSAVSIAAVQEASGVFLLSADGRGTIRLMAGFRANKALGAGGKVALKTDRLIAAATVDTDDDVLIISRLGKLIRFQVQEVPRKEGVVQGVNCMALRADETAAVAIGRRAPTD